MTIVAVLDANVLFPMYLRDTLLRLARTGCFRLHWSNRILDEMTRNLVSGHRMTREGADRLEAKMRATFPEAMVLDWERFEAGMTNDSKDRHVAAAAAAIEASVIVTRNIKDFKSLPSGISAVTPDAFLISLLESHPEEVTDALETQSRGYRRPPATTMELAGWLAETAPEFVARIAEYFAQPKALGSPAP